MSINEQINAITSRVADDAHQVWFSLIYTHADPVRTRMGANKRSDIRSDMHVEGVLDCVGRFAQRFHGY